MTLKIEFLEGEPQEKPQVYVGWDDFKISPDSLWTDGVGSCLAVALYDPKRKLGALAHISGVRNTKVVPEALYPENVINTLISRLGKYEQLEAVLAGEESLSKPKMSDVVKENLTSLQIPIIGEDLGYVDDFRGREVHLVSEAGIIKVCRYIPLF